ncbi:hypothetical protein V9K67_04855 [Paraflavisolibacter sp. H34]|uniref:hypothetical protein n=1 Tax=Huijunlia imazamoxiresistens TaxID=3127457 RepID=UPI00301778B8
MNQIRENDESENKSPHPPPGETAKPGGGEQPHHYPPEPQIQKLAKNPNPRANENIRDHPLGDGAAASEGPGSEITDGEDG